MKKFIANMIILFFSLEIITGLGLFFLHGVESNFGLMMLSVLGFLHRNVLGWVYLVLVLAHCYLLKGRIWSQIKLGSINIRYVLVFAMFILSFLAFVPARVFGPYPISMIVHGVTIPALLGALMYMHIKIQKRLKAEREEPHPVAG